MLANNVRIERSAAKAAIDCVGLYGAARSRALSKQRYKLELTPACFYSAFGLIAFSSFPSMARGNSMALNSAPTKTTSETMYIHTNKAMAAPSEP